MIPVGYRYSEELENAFPERSLTREQAILLLKYHGWRPNVQTATKDGKEVESGSSFDEVFGKEGPYRRNKVFEWLGY